jgi:hypothetical protein
MLADTLPVHAQNFFLACATAIPALFVAISVQRLPWGRPGFVVNIVKIPASPEGPVYDMRIFQGLTLNWPILVAAGGLLYCLAGEAAALGGLIFDVRGWLFDIFAGGGVIIAMGAVILGLVFGAGVITDDSGESGQPHSG